jgi:hypothetical protein
MDRRENCNISLGSQPDLKIQMCLVVEGRDYGVRAALVHPGPDTLFRRNSRRLHV